MPDHEHGSEPEPTWYAEVQYRIDLDPDTMDDTLEAFAGEATAAHYNSAEQLLRVSTIFYGRGWTFEDAVHHAGVWERSPAVRGTVLTAGGGEPVRLLVEDWPAHVQQWAVTAEQAAVLFGVDPSRFRHLKSGATPDPVMVAGRTRVYRRDEAETAARRRNPRPGRPPRETA